jgi:hypothetical protein
MRYGDDKTIHRTQQVNVELDKNGKVVSVWFRCMTLPFTQTIVDNSRAEEMINAYKISPPKSLNAVIVGDDE